MVQRTSAKRLLPGTDLREQLEALARDEGIKAGVLLCLVGSLTRARIRLAGANGFLDLEGPLEIVSATGTLSAKKVHIHICVARDSGEVLGGHLIDGCVVYTTAEAVVLNMSDEYEFDYDDDATTGYPELAPRRVQQ